MGTHLPVIALIDLHWNLTTARISRGRPHCLRRFYHARTVTGRKYHYPLRLSSPVPKMRSGLRDSVKRIEEPWRAITSSLSVPCSSCGSHVTHTAEKVANTLVFSSLWKVYFSLPLSSPRECVFYNQNQKFFIFF